MLLLLDQVLFDRTQCRFDDRSVIVRGRARGSSVRLVSGLPNRGNFWLVLPYSLGELFNVIEARIKVVF